MGAPESGMHAAEQPGAEELLGAFKRIGADERRQHEAVLNYWLSIRGDKEFPPLHDLDPLELSDAAPSSILLELISGGHDAEIRHLGESLRSHVDVERIIDAPHPSLLSSIAKKLPIVAISRDFLAYEDEFAGSQGKIRCWVTLLPLSAGGAWVDYVYGLVSLAVEEGVVAEPAKKPAKKADAPEPSAAEAEGQAPEATEEAVADTPEAPLPEVAEESGAVEEPGGAAETVAEAEPEETSEPVEETPEEVEETPQAVEAEEPEAVAVEPEPEVAAEPEARTEGAAAESSAAEVEQEPEAPEAVAEPAAKGVPGFAKLFDSLAGLTGFYGSQPVKLEPVIDEAQTAAEPVEEAPAADEPVDETPAAEEPVVEATVEEAVADEAPIEEEIVEEAVADEAPIEEEIVEEAPDEASSATEQPAAEAPPADHQPAPAMEGSLQSKLTQVRAKADEVRQARQRVIAALHEGLSAAYDFALDAEEAPEEYLKLVEAQGLKIQLRSPMKPVVKLAFDGTCDEATIKQLEAVLAWALKEELPKGSLSQRIEDAGGIEGLLNGERKAA